MATESSIISGMQTLEALERAAARAPHAAALFCDIDGTVSPIAPTPAEARVPETFRELLTRLAGRLGLVAFVTGRDLEDGRRLVGVEGVTYVGTHGLETMDPDGRMTVDPQAQLYVAAVHDIAEAAARDLDCAALGIVLEDKRTMLAVHYRLAPDPATAQHQIMTWVAEPARERGLVIATGHFMVEVRPPLPFSKGRTVRRLLDGGQYFSVLSCGDDLTDVTMFDAVRAWGDSDGRRRTVAVAAVTEETPRPVTEAADALVHGTPGVHEVLSRLARAVGA